MSCRPLNPMVSLPKWTQISLFPSNCYSLNLTVIFHLCCCNASEFVSLLLGPMLNLSLLLELFFLASKSLSFQLFSYLFILISSVISYNLMALKTLEMFLVLSHPWVIISNCQASNPFECWGSISNLRGSKLDLVISQAPTSLSSFLRICKWHHPNSVFFLLKAGSSLPNPYHTHYQVLSVCLQNIFRIYLLLNPWPPPWPILVMFLYSRVQLLPLSLLFLHSGANKSTHTEGKWL